jgi:hypothetical protein
MRDDGEERIRKYYSALIVGNAKLVRWVFGEK